MAFSAKLVIYSKSNISFIMLSSMSQCGHSLFSSIPHNSMFHRNLRKVRDIQTEDFHHVSVIPLSAYIAI